MSSESFAHATRARDCRVRVDRPGRAWIDLLVRDPLVEVIPALPMPPVAVDLAAVPVGRTEDGAPWRDHLRGGCS